ncbi:hypothetical protein PVAP13_2KG076016 [Panicum virgatum]|uniref:Uncharacterized protein n=1 Tax=Panicum virgatum TaxID=38727 RepID=A0A8T0W5A6_PANVG|nr:hypothetical protein PVAP13_2KG076016 [Panicum virgatum]
MFDYSIVATALWPPTTLAEGLRLTPRTIERNTLCTHMPRFNGSKSAPSSTRFMPFRW